MEKYTLDEASELALQVKWKTSSCGNDTCWCRIIEPDEPILYGENNEEFYIIGSGAVDKEFAEYFVFLHNESYNK